MVGYHADDDDDDDGDGDDDDGEIMLMMMTMMVMVMMTKMMVMMIKDLGSKTHYYHDNGDDDDGESGNSFTSYYAKAPSPLENHTACFPETQFRQNHSFDPRKK